MSSSIAEPSLSRELGSLEFINAINGIDPIAALRSLRKFARVVRRERKSALYLLPRRALSVDPAAIQEDAKYANSNSEDEPSGEDDGDYMDEMSITSNSDKPQRDDWKSDSAGYNVPFVGTSVVKGSTGTVRCGMWPCGLLEQYLRESPRAVELLGGASVDGKDDNTNPLVPPHGALHKSLLKSGTNRARLSLALHEAYLDAVSELATAIIPISVLIRDLVWEYNKDVQVAPTIHRIQAVVKNPSDDKDRVAAISTSFVREHLRQLLHLLSSQCAQAKVDVYGKKGGSAKYRKGVGLLAPKTIRILTHISMSSIGGSREVARGLESELGEGTLKALLTSSSGGRPMTTSRVTGGKKRKLEEGDEKENADNSRAMAGDGISTKAPMDVRTAALCLSAALIESGDVTVQSFACSPGSKERKTNPGIVHLALRFGLVGGALDSRSDPEKRRHLTEGLFLQSIARLVSSIRCHVLPSHENNWRSRSQRLDNRIIMKLLNPEAMDKLIQVSALAPPLESTTAYNAVLSGSDIYRLSEENASVELCAVECRRLVFILLADPVRSPFLKQIGENSVKYFSPTAQTSHVNTISKALCRLIATDSSLPMRNFVIRCLRVTPQLLSSCFRLLPIPDPKPNYACLSSMAFFSGVLREGPTIFDCATASKCDGALPSKAEHLIVYIAPQSLSKTFLTKAVQSQNSLLVMEALRVISNILKRVQNSGQDSFRLLLADSTQRRLPDLQALLSLRSRYDPFKNFRCDDVGCKDKSDLSLQELVMFRLCQTLRLYGKILPEAVRSAKFDWSKLLPDDLETFFQVSASLQVEVLTTLHILSSEAATYALALPSKLFQTLLRISLTSTAPEVYSLARKMGIQILLNDLSDEKAADNESAVCRHFEVSLWIDGTCEGTFNEVSRLASAAPEYVAQHALLTTRAWKTTFPDRPVPQTYFSPLLSSAIAGIFLRPSAFSSAFIRMVCRIATRSLLFHRYQQPLAALIIFCFDDIAAAELNSDKDRNLLRSVNSFTKALLSQSSDALIVLQTLLRNSFGDSNLLLDVCTAYGIEKSEPIQLSCLAELDSATLTVVIRQCLNQLKLSDYVCISRRNHGNLHKIIKVALIHLLMRRSDNIAETLEFLFDRFEPGEESSGVEDLSTFTMILSNSCLSEETVQIISTSCDDWLRNTIVRATIPNTGLVALLSPLTLPSFSITAMKWLLGADDLLKEQVYCALLYTLIVQIGNATDAGVLDKDFPVQEAFMFWLQHPERNGSMALALEKVMSRLFLSPTKQNGLIIAKLYNCVHTHRSIILEQWIRCIKPDGSCSPLIDAMARYDPDFIFSWLDNVATPTTMKSLPDSLIICILMGSHSIQTNESKLWPIAMVRIENMLTSTSQSGFRRAEVAQIRSWIPLVKKIVSRAVAEKDIDFVTSVYRPFEIWLQALLRLPHTKLDPSMEESMLDIICLGMAKDSSQSERTRNTVSLAFLRLCDLASRGLRKRAKGKNVDPRFALEKLYIILSNKFDLDFSTIFQDEKYVRGCIISCLKSGINGPNGVDDSGVASQCLRLVRAMVTNSSFCDIFSPGQIHQMIISHSMFRAAMIVSPQQIRDATSCQALELSRLLITCVSLANEKIQVDKETWQVICEGYNAGVNAHGKSLRRLMYLYIGDTLYTEADDQNDAIPMIDELKWGKLVDTDDSWMSNQASLEGSDHAREYEWFVNALELRRVRATLKYFPIWEALIPSPDREIEVWLSKVDEAGIIGEEDSNDGSCLSGSESSDDEKYHSQLSRRARRDEREHDWTGSGTDNRYSPSFILSLVLATLHAFDPLLDGGKATANSGTACYNEEADAGRDSKSGVGRDTDNPHHETFVKIARRLSDKGCISLSLAALSSKCPDLRRVAAATLGLFLRVVDMKEAKELKTWRERPQIAMILNSIQRALALRRISMLEQRKEEGMIFVPMLPAVSAIFFAWSVLLVSRPSDDMYGPVNRFFLRLEDNQGAYKECFTLTAFISLFCGSLTDDNGQARRERLWALQLLKDGVRDSFSYKVSSRRHAPALIMSSFDSLSLRLDGNVSDAEPYMMLDTLESLLVNGGRLARVHLISSVGVLSWFTGLLVGRGRSPLFSLHQRLKSKFVQLIGTGYHCGYEQEMEDSGSIGLDYLRHAATSIAGPVMDFYAGADATEPRFLKGNDEGDAEDYSRQTIRVIKTLASIVDTKAHDIDRKNHDIDRNAIHMNGIRLKPALILLEAVGAASVGTSLCVLPMSPNPDDASERNLAKKICLIFLKCVLESDEESTGIDHNIIFNRIANLFGVFKGAFDLDSELIDRIMVVRLKASRHSLQAWESCLASIASCCNSEDEEDMISIVVRALNHK